MPVRCKRVYDPPEPEDGTRVLVTYYWPRGLPKTAVDRWYRALGTPPALIKPWQGGQMSPETFRATYLAALQTEEATRLIRELAELSRTGNVTLLTSFRELNRSHVWILKELVEQQAAALSP